MASDLTPRMLIAKCLDMLNDELDEIGHRQGNGEPLQASEIKSLTDIVNALVKIKREERSSLPTEDDLAMMTEEELNKLMLDAVKKMEGVKIIEDKK